MKLEDVEALLRENGLVEGMRCIDIGVGDEELLFRVATIIGSSGVVYAVDKDDTRLKEVVRKAEEKGVSNIVVHHSGLLERITYLPNEMFDFAILHSTLERVGEYQLTLFNETHRLLRKGGKAYVYVRMKRFLGGGGVSKKLLEKTMKIQPLKVDKRIERGRELIMFLRRVE